MNDWVDPQGVMWFLSPLRTTMQESANKLAKSSWDHRLTGKPEHDSGPSGEKVAMTMCEPERVARSTLST